MISSAAAWQTLFLRTFLLFLLEILRLQVTVPSDASEIVVVLSKMTITSDLPLASNSLYSKVWVKKLAHAKPWPGGGGGSACAAHWRSSRKTTLVNFHHPSISDSEAPTLVKSRLVKNPL